MDNNISFKRSFLFISFFLVGYVTLFTATLPDGFELSAQDFNSEDEILSNINQTLLSLIPLMIQEVENTNATDIPIKQVMEATPSNVTALQNILNNETDQNVSDNVSSTSTPNSSSSSSSNTTIPTANTTTPKDLIPVVVNLTQNTNATDIPIKNVINSVPSNVTALQNILNNETDQNVSDNVSSTSTPNSSSSSSSSNTTIPTANTTTPKDLIPVVVNLTQNTNATDIGIMRIINATPDLNTLESNIYNSE